MGLAGLWVVISPAPGPPGPRGGQSWPPAPLPLPKGVRVCPIRLLPLAVSQAALLFLLLTNNPAF